MTEKRYLEPRSDFDSAIHAEDDFNVTYHYSDVVSVLMDIFDDKQTDQDTLYEKAEDHFWQEIHPNYQSGCLTFIYPGNL